MSLYSSSSSSSDTPTSINSRVKKERNSSMARPCSLFAFCGLFFFFLPCLCCPEQQKQALLQFKSSILAITSLRNSSYFPLESWNSGSSCCRWTRVDCNDSPNSTSRVVISVDLGTLFIDQSVQSTILAPIFHIRSLELLFIGYNNIQGEIPAVGFANLSNLVELDMSGNNFSGSVPSQLFHLPLLQYLHLDDNSLSGKVPEEIGNLSRLQWLSLSGNKFSDGMLLSVLTLKGLEFLDLSNNDLSMEIPAEIGNLPNISTLGLNKSCNSYTNFAQIIIANDFRIILFFVEIIIRLKFKLE